MGAFLLPAIPCRRRVFAPSCRVCQTVICLAHQLPCRDDQTIGVEVAQLFFRHPFNARAVGGLQKIEQRAEPRQRATE